MNKTVTSLLFAVAVAEAIIMWGLIIKPSKIELLVSVQPARNPSPLYWALEYDMPDDRFDELVKKDPKWVRYRDPITGWSALTDCVALKRTNCVRILISNGASFDEEIGAAKNANDDGAVILLKQFQSQLR
jgi:hypothetical protein